MIVAENMEQLMNVKKSSVLNEVLFEGMKFVFIHENENVQRGKHDNLTAITYRNEEERKNLTLFYNDEIMEFVETGYSIN